MCGRGVLPAGTNRERSARVLKSPHRVLPHACRQVNFMDIQNQRILIIKQSSLGDIVHTLPVAHALKRCFPDCHIGWVVERAFAPLVAQDTAVDAVYPIHIPSTSEPGARWYIAYPQAFWATMRVVHGLWTALRAAPYDLILDLHASFRSGLLSLMNGGGLRVGFRDARELNTLFQHRLVSIPDHTVHAVDKNLLFCELLGCVPTDADFFLCSDRTDEQSAANFLTAHGIQGDLPFVYVNPTARWQSKFWLQPRWSELCDRLLAAGIHVVFGGSAADLPYISGITERMAGAGVVAAGRLTLTESVALMKRASVYVGVDTGPMHMAAMAGIPVVALFGPTHPERVGPYRARGVVLQANSIECLCCRRRVCRHMRCMEGISVETVYQQVLDFVVMPAR